MRLSRLPARILPFINSRAEGFSTAAVLRLKDLDGVCRGNSTFSFVMEMAEDGSLRDSTGDLSSDD